VTTTKDDEDRQRRSVPLQNGNTIPTDRKRAEETLRESEQELRKARNELEVKVAERTAELQRSKAYLAEAQRLSRTGSFGWRISTGEIVWSEETFQIFQYDRMTKPTVELVLQRVHPEDAALVKQTIERASQDGKDFVHEYRLVMPDGSVKFVHVAAHALTDESGGIEFVGAVMDVTAAKRAEGRIRQIIDTIPAYAWSSAPDGSVDFINRRFVEFAGRSMDELLGWGWGSTVHPDDLPRYVGVWCAALAAGEPVESEVRVRGRDGEYRWLLIRNVPLRDDLGNIVKWYGTAIEIEDRKRTEVLLAGEKRLLEMIARGNSLALILDGTCRLVEELATGSLSSILLLDPSANCLRHGASPSLPIAYTSAIDGEVIGPSAGSCGTAAYRAEQVIVSDIATDPLWTDYRDLALPHGLRACWSTPILSSGGKVLGTFATYYREPRSPSPQEQNVIERITHLASIALEREQGEKKLRQSEAYLCEVQRLSHTGSLYWKSASGELAWSEETSRIYEYDLTTTPRLELVFQRIHPNDRAFIEQTHRFFQEEDRRRKGENLDVEVEYRLLMPDGRVKHLHAISHTLHDSSGNLEILAAVMDVTARKQSEEALRQAQADLAHVNRVTTMGELTASIAHEISQPVAAVIANAGVSLRLLAKGPPDVDKARECLELTLKDGVRAGEIVKRIRALVKKSPPRKDWVDVNKTILEVIELTRSEALRHHVSLKSRLSADLPLIWGDRIQLQQVILNLIINAIEAMSGLIPADLVISSGKDGLDSVRVSVLDWGEGLMEGTPDRLFEAFYTTKPNGMGMGLAISRSIISDHGGRLWATPNAPRGAVFQFTLPRDSEGPGREA
jgi:PAS domain S-box-containing protein